MDSDRKITIKDVARMAGVSKGTVDRVIHNRGEVSPESLDRVMEVIRKIGYKPNAYASLLASRRHYRFACIMPDFAPGGFWEIVHRGIEMGSKECRDLNIGIETVRYDQFDVDSFRQACRSVQETRPDAVLIVPMFTQYAARFVAELEESGIPYVYIESKIAGTGYLAYYGMPVFESGYVAASLLLKRAPADEIVCFRFRRRGDASSNTASGRLEGFTSYIREHAPECKLHSEYLSHSDAAYNRQVLDDFFRRHRSVRHIVTFNSRGYIIGEYLQEHGLHDKILLGYDPLERNVACMKSGCMEFILAQKGTTQAYRGVKALCNRFVFKKAPSKQDNYMPIEILTAENVNYYSDLEID